MTELLNNFFLSLLENAKIIICSFVIIILVSFVAYLLGRMFGAGFAKSWKQENSEENGGTKNG